MVSLANFKDSGAAEETVMLDANGQQIKLKLALSTSDPKAKCAARRARRADDSGRCIVGTRNERIATFGVRMLFLLPRNLLGLTLP